MRSTAGSVFDFEQLRLAAARRLPAACYDDFLRLSRTLVHGPVFQWLLVDAPDEGLDAGGAAKAEAKQLLAAAYLSLARMGLPEATRLAELMRQRGLTPPGL